MWCAFGSGCQVRVDALEFELHTGSCESSSVGAEIQTSGPLQVLCSLNP